jgi:hypothetical protein
MEMKVARSSIFDYFYYFAKFWQIATKLKHEISLCSWRYKFTFISSQVLRTWFLHFSQSEELIHSNQISNQNVFWLEGTNWDTNYSSGSPFVGFAQWIFFASCLIMKLLGSAQRKMSSRRSTFAGSAQRQKVFMPHSKCFGTVQMEN